MALKDGRKADYVGNHGGKYTDIDGMSKQFTYVDHDKKTKIATSSEKMDFTAFFAEYRANLIKRITDIPASLCHELFQDFTIRGENSSKIEWNTDMLLDAGVPLKLLTDLCTVLENTVELRGLTSKIIKTY